MSLSFLGNDNRGLQQFGFGFNWGIYTEHTFISLVQHKKAF